MLPLAGLKKALKKEDWSDFRHVSQPRPRCKSQFELTLRPLQPKESRKLHTLGSTLKHHQQQGGGSRADGGKKVKMRASVETKARG